MQARHHPAAGGNDTDRWLGPARALVEARLSANGLDTLPRALRPHDLQSAWQVQMQVTQLLAARGDSVVGWKCATPLADKLIAAPIYGSLLYKTSRGDADRLATNCNAWVDVEPEMAVVMQGDLPSRDHAYTAREIHSCIGAIHPALEIIGSRYAEPSARTFPELLADGLLNNGLVLADRIQVEVNSPPAQMALAIDVEGQVTMHEGVHPEGEVLRPLHWLVNFLRERGLGLRERDLVITGSFAGALRIPVGRRVTVAFGDLGTMQLRFETNQYKD